VLPISSKLYAGHVDKGLGEKPTVNEPLLNLMFCFKKKIVADIRTAYAGDQPVGVLDTISNGEAVSYRFEIQV
jgi:hypothetical protein